jgi:cation transport ATPase
MFQKNLFIKKEKFMIHPILKKLFVLHFIIDYIVALPLMLAPVATMSFFGWNNPEPVATRLVAAALMGIGGISFIARDADAAAYRHMLTMKLIWSGAAVLGLAFSIMEGAPSFTWVFLLIFTAFFGIWFLFRMKI